MTLEKRIKALIKECQEIYNYTSDRSLQQYISGKIKAYEEILELLSRWI